MTETMQILTGIGYMVVTIIATGFLMELFPDDDGVVVFGGIFWPVAIVCTLVVGVIAGLGAIGGALGRLLK